MRVPQGPPAIFRGNGADDPGRPDFSVECRSRPARSNSDYHCEFLEADDKLRRDVTSPPHSSEPAIRTGLRSRVGSGINCNVQIRAGLDAIPTTPRSQSPACHFAST